MIAEIDQGNQLTISQLLEERLDGIENGGVIYLDRELQGLTLECLPNNIIRLDGIKDHINNGGNGEQSLLEAINPLVPKETMIEVRVEDKETLDHLLTNLPTPFQFINDSVSRVYQHQSLAYLAHPFHPDSREARLLRCYSNSTQLFSDPIGAVFTLRALVSQDDLYLANPIAKTCWWIEQTKRPGGIGGDLRRWI